MPFSTKREQGPLQEIVNFSTGKGKGDELGVSFFSQKNAIIQIAMEIYKKNTGINLKGQIYEI